jgi:hypothetical protein
MNKFRIKFYELSFIILLLACSTASSIILVDENKVSVAWDPVTTTDMNTPTSWSRITWDIPEGYEVRYLIYIAHPDMHDRVLVEKYVDEILVDKETPITETNCTIRFKDNGQFVIGVQSVLYDEEKNIKKRSTIAWSDNKMRTSKRPFIIRVEK